MLHPLPTPATLLLLLIGFRLLNALSIRTFFQPDEYYQSLEPAWELAFGHGSGAWITWEWSCRLRSSIHPSIFAAVYRLTASLSTATGIRPVAFRAELLLAAPKLLQALIAAIGDFYTWQLANTVYGFQTSVSTTALLLSIISPWQWFCSTRTLSNCLETTLTTIALSLWPWQRCFTPDHPVGSNLLHNHGNLSRIRGALVLAAVACVLRPTNVLIWLSVAAATLVQASSTDSLVLIRESFLCGSTVLAFSAVSDRLYYGVWTLPAVRFLHFNLAQNLAVFYGKNRSDYYLTEGLPLLLTTALPFAIVGLYWALRSQPYAAIPPASTPKNKHVVPAQATGAVNAEAQSHAQPALTTLAYTVLIVTFVMSMIRHKEVRFLYPLLPALHILAAQPFHAFFFHASPLPNTRRLALFALLSFNIALALYTSQVHQRGVVDVLTYLRARQESPIYARPRLAADADPPPSPPFPFTTASHDPLTVAFLMPCHSTPWRSHLIHAATSAWALSCEPPLDVPLHDRAGYLDEADQFYADPPRWLAANMRRPVGGRLYATDSSSSSSSSSTSTSNADKRGLPAAMGPGAWTGRYAWPECIVMFDILLADVGGVLGAKGYGEVWRGFNSHWHDDWRRRGDVVVWCRAEERGDGGGGGGGPGGSVGET
ncbi:hypothetical protein EJ05DRAFT_474701 [Pseudovirgaria hyperparasitica]|uniref:Mannosyltransferase n=1 Tax=Pseudovirgaria hyperparasitica TaxID=470096 RepID=A0A6A6W9U6_9PEZI|nr:uncharacterized protein EJ05DRAFT_474701 [Pseudovirgaria hyperparasitica]KAF2759622.1 hypothetical protein EJ05DRAFT_474701 [Pseudovirgaria hyperparasitica]